MKKICLMLLIVCILTVGCVKYEVGMTIDSDESITLDLVYAVNNSLISFAGNGNVMDTEDVRQKLIDSGFEVKEYKTESLAGISASKKLGELNDLATNDDVVFELTELVNKKFDNVKMFKLENKGFKNNYKATFTFNMVNDDGDETQSEEYDYDYSEYIDVKFVLKSKCALKNHNADEVSEDGIYTWKPKYGVLNNINFEFSTQYNKTIYILLLASAIIILVILICIVRLFIRKINKNKEIKNNSTEIEILDIDI